MDNDVQNRFNALAESWDEDPRRLRLAEAVTAAILDAVPVSTDMDAMDYGCGTGLVALCLQPHVRTITGADCSPRMLEMLNHKIGALGLTNASAVYTDLASDPVPDARFDLIVSSMALHHVKEPSSLLQKLYVMLKPGGYLCIADLETESGDFHQDKTGVEHFGFDRGEIAALFLRMGLVSVGVRTAYTMTRDANGGVTEFPIFLVSGQAPQ